MFLFQHLNNLFLENNFIEFNLRIDVNEKTGEKLSNGWEYLSRLCTIKGHQRRYTSFVR